MRGKLFFGISVILMCIIICMVCCLVARADSFNVGGGESFGGASVQSVGSDGGENGFSTGSMRSSSSAMEEYFQSEADTSNPRTEVVISDIETQAVDIETVQSYINTSQSIANPYNSAQMTNLFSDLSRNEVQVNEMGVEAGNPQDEQFAQYQSLAFPDGIEDFSPDYVTIPHDELPEKYSDFRSAMYDWDKDGALELCVREDMYNDPLVRQQIKTYEYAKMNDKNAIQARNEEIKFRTWASLGEYYETSSAAAAALGDAAKAGDPENRERAVDAIEDLSPALLGIAKSYTDDETRVNALYALGMGSYAGSSNADAALATLFPEEKIYDYINGDGEFLNRDQMAFANFANRLLFFEEDYNSYCQGYYLRYEGRQITFKNLPVFTDHFSTEALTEILRNNFYAREGTPLTNDDTESVVLIYPMTPYSDALPYGYGTMFWMDTKDVVDNMIFEEGMTVNGYILIETRDLDDLLLEATKDKPADYIVFNGTASDDAQTIVFRYLNDPTHCEGEIWLNEKSGTQLLRDAGISPTLKEGGTVVVNVNNVKQAGDFADMLEGVFPQAGNIYVNNQDQDVPYFLQFPAIPDFTDADWNNLVNRAKVLRRK